jgi:hypothetical protein
MNQATSRSFDGPCESGDVNDARRIGGVFVDVGAVSIGEARLEDAAHDGAQRLFRPVEARLAPRRRIGLIRDGRNDGEGSGEWSADAGVGSPSLPPEGGVQPRWSRCLGAQGSAAPGSSYDHEPENSSHVLPA